MRKLLLIPVVFCLAVIPLKTVVWDENSVIGVKIFNESNYLAKDINIVISDQNFYIKYLGPGDSYIIYPKLSLNYGLNMINYKVKYDLYAKYFTESSISKYYSDVEFSGDFPIILGKKEKPKIEGKLYYYSKSKLLVDFNFDIADVLISSNCKVLTQKVNSGKFYLEIIPTDTRCVLDFNVTYYVNDIPVNYTTEISLPVEYIEPVEISLDKNLKIKTIFERTCYTINSECEVRGKLSGCFANEKEIPLEILGDCPIKINVEGYVGTVKYQKEYVIYPKKNIKIDVSISGDFEVGKKTKAKLTLYNLSRYPLNYEYLKLECENCILEQNTLLFSDLEEYDYDEREIYVTPLSPKFKIKVIGYGNSKINKEFILKSKTPGFNLLYLIAFVIGFVIGYLLARYLLVKFKVIK
jgi:hypothetical protein